MTGQAQEITIDEDGTDEKRRVSSLQVPDLSGQTINSRYRVIKPLADGGMSRIFLAEQLDLKRTVAIKFLRIPPAVADGDHDLWRKRFEREAAVLAGLQHPNIVVVHEYGTTDTGLAYLVMEYVEGETLAAFVRSSTHLEPQLILRLSDKIASALEEAHQAGIVHRDLKPQNVMLVRGRTNRLKVLDFGLAKMLEGERDEEDVTQADVRLGSPRYMSPEQVNGDTITPAADVYALGCVMYFMATGRPPFINANSISLMLMHVKDEPPPLHVANPQNTVSLALTDVIMRCLRKDPTQRFASMSELLEALATCPEHSMEISGSMSVSMPRRLDSSQTQSFLANPQLGSGPKAKEPEKRPVARWLSAAVVVGVGVMAGLIALAVGGEDEPAIDETTSSVGVLPTVTEEALDAPPPPVVAPEQAPTVVLITTDPPGASIRHDGAELGTSPLRVQVRPGASQRVEISMRGYQTVTGNLSSVEPNPVFRLVRSAPAPTWSPRPHSNTRRQDPDEPAPQQPVVESHPEPRVQPDVRPEPSPPPPRVETRGRAVPSDNIDPWSN